MAPLRSWNRALTGANNVIKNSCTYVLHGKEENEGSRNMETPGTTAKGLSATLFERAGMPPIKDLIPCSLQHVLASFAGVITPALIIAAMCGFTEEQKTAIIQVALILSAIDSLLQQFPLFGRIGSGLPILTGVSFAFLPAFQAVGIEFGFSSLLGAELVGGAVAIVFGMFYSKVKFLFPPFVTGTVIFTIGVSLYPTVIRYMAGGEGTPGFGGVANWIVGLITFAVVFGLTNFGRGTVKLGAIFFGIVIGVLVSIPFGMVDPSDVAQAVPVSHRVLHRRMPYACRRLHHGQRAAHRRPLRVHHGQHEPHVHRARAWRRP